MDRTCLIGMRGFLAKACNLQGVRLMTGEMTREEFWFFKEYVLGVDMKLGELAG